MPINTLNIATNGILGDPLNRATLGFISSIIAAIGRGLSGLSGLSGIFG